MKTTDIKKYDAILLAGEGESSYKVLNRHKAFLKINGECIINYVVETLRKVELVQSIYIVGFKDKLLQTLRDSDIDLNYPKPIHILQQQANLYENIWCAFLQTLQSKGDKPDLNDPRNINKAVLIVPCDAPLMTPHEVEYFISHCETDRYDHVLGLTAEKNLEYFYSRSGRPGIKMSYLHLQEKRYRINNLHLVKPLRIGNRQYIQKMYQYRYQRNIKNVFLFGLSLIGKEHPINLRFYFGLQLALLFSKCGLKPLANFFRTWTSKKDLENCISNLLNTRFIGLEAPFPGAALDIDNEKDYKVMCSRFSEWRKYLTKISSSTPLPIRSESLV